LSFKLLFGPSHVPFPVLFAAPLLIEAQNENIVPFILELAPSLLKVATSAISDRDTIPNGVYR